MKKSTVKKMIFVGIVFASLAIGATKTQAGEMVYYNGQWYPVVSSTPTPHGPVVQSTPQTYSSNPYPVGSYNYNNYQRGQAALPHSDSIQRRADAKNATRSVFAHTFGWSPF